MSIKKWMLPEGVEEALPPISWQLEDLRRKLLDDYRGRGYQLILPPLIEHLDALLTGTAQDLDARTFKFTDPLSGRLLGLRSDMTPQAARIAARQFRDQPVVRLCYLGTVLRAQSDSLGGSRSPRQVGCELFGAEGVEADLEIIGLMLNTLRLAGVQAAHLDLGHVDIYRSLSAQLALDPEDEAQLFDILQRKSRPDLQALAEARQLPAGVSPLFAELMDLHGGEEVLARARASLQSAGPAVQAALDSLERIVAGLRQELPDLPVHIDLGELRGYRYHTGMVFAAFAPGLGREIARGGRYDGVGAEFGLSRPATGFSADLNELLRLGTA